MNNKLKKLVLCTLFFVALGIVAQAEVVRLGVAGAIDFMEKPDYHTIVSEYSAEENPWAGFYWEVLLHHFGFGGTYLAHFDKQAAVTDPAYYDWTINWMGTFDFRYHFFTKFIIDPFLEFGIGCAGSVFVPYGTEIHTAEEVLNNPDEYDLHISLFSDLGLGLALRLKRFHVGGKLNYYFISDQVPMTQFTPYPVENFSCSLFGGVSF
jgi:hypothetical protein